MQIQQLAHQHHQHNAAEGMQSQWGYVLAVQTKIDPTDDMLELKAWQVASQVHES